MDDPRYLLYPQLPKTTLNQPQKNTNLAGNDIKFNQISRKSAKEIKLILFSIVICCILSILSFELEDFNPFSQCFIL